LKFRWKLGVASRMKRPLPDLLPLPPEDFLELLELLEPFFPLLLVDPSAAVGESVSRVGSGDTVGCGESVGALGSGETVGILVGLLGPKP
jgi:hypothetical protein